MPCARLSPPRPRALRSAPPTGPRRAPGARPARRGSRPPRPARPPAPRSGRRAAPSRAGGPP
ncbi:hypothetical protein [Ornithinimicrobium kibberense]|uniref:hypothetical protein n=1 Tax=Ornithinimicrobium kibberense TaxID=282060 RepID=UPI00361508D1